MFLRTLMIGVAGAIGGVIAVGLAPWLAGDPPFDAIYWFWTAAAVAAVGVFINIVFEYLGLYNGSLWHRFFGRKRD